MTELKFNSLEFPPLPCSTVELRFFHDSDSSALPVLFPNLSEHQLLCLWALREFSCSSCFFSSLFFCCCSLKRMRILKKIYEKIILFDYFEFFYDILTIASAPFQVLRCGRGSFHLFPKILYIFGHFRMKWVQQPFSSRVLAHSINRQSHDPLLFINGLHLHPQLFF